MKLPTPRLARVPAAPPLAAALELAGLGIGLTLACGLMATLSSWSRQLPTFQALYAVGFGIFALALAGLPRYARLPRAGLAVFAVALAARAALLPVTPTLSTDLYRYAWEGRVLAAGGDPYRAAPLDSSLAPLRDRRVWPRVNHPELSTIYPPFALAGFALVSRISASLLALKLWIVLHDLALVALLIAWARRRTGSAVPAIAYAWNPLVLVEYAGGAHHDPTALLWMVVALMLAEERPVLAAVGLAVGALVKLAPLVVAPILLVRWPWRARLAALGLLGVGLGWYLLETRHPGSGLGAYWSTWRNNELIFHLLERATGSFAIARAIALAGVAGAVAWSIRAGLEPAAAARLALGTAVLVSPVLHPWYLGWVLVLEPLEPSVGWQLLSLTALLSYGVFEVPPADGSFHLPLAWRAVEYGIPLAGVVVARLVFRRPDALRAVP